MNLVSSAASTTSSPTRGVTPAPPIPAPIPWGPTSPRPMGPVQIARSHPIASGSASTAFTAQITPPLRDRTVESPGTDESLASRKRKREDPSFSPLADGCDSPQRDAKQARHTLTGRDPETAPSTPLLPPPALAGATTPPTVTSACATAPRAEAHPAAEIASDDDLDERLPPMHGEYVSVYNGAPAALAGGAALTGAGTASGELLYEQAVYTESSGIIAISTCANRGVFAEGIGPGIAVILSNTAGIGLMVLVPGESETWEDDFASARSEFIDRTGSDQDIRIRIAHNSQGVRNALEPLWNAMSLEIVRTALHLQPESSDAQVHEAATTLLLAQRVTGLETLAAQWGGLGPLVDLPHGALHVSQAGLDVFQAPPTFDLPANLIEVPQAQQD